MLLAPQFLAQLERLQLVNRRRLTGTLMGEHRSPRHGPSLDFADFRDYYPGDDLRRLDVAALARLDRLLLTLYDAEDDLTLRLLVAPSGSMDRETLQPAPALARPDRPLLKLCHAVDDLRRRRRGDTAGSVEGEKLQRATELAGALGFVALTRRDEVVLSEFPPAGHPRRFRGRASAVELFEHLAGLKAAGETRLSQAADRLLSQRGSAGLVVVISDLLTADWDDGLRRLPARGADLAVVHLVHPSDLDPVLEGDLELVDAETAERLEVSLNADIVADYRSAALAWADDVAARVRSRGGVYVRVLSSESVETMLLRRARDARILR